jgi:short-subunit dehydrogenase
MWMTTTTKPLAVVTGASSGLALAKQFARHDFDLVIAAQDDELDAAADQVRACGAQVDAVRADLAAPDGVEELVQHIAAAGRPVDALAVNAGVGINGEFAGTTLLEDQLTVVDLNVRSAVHVTKRVVPGMVDRGQGRALFTSSIAGTASGDIGDRDRAGH